MKVSLALFIMLFTNNIFAKSQLEMSGFKLVKSTAEFKQFKFHDDEVYTISTKKFSSQKDAENFCISQKMTLDKEGSAILFAMSGAANSNKFIKEAISYKIVVKDFKESGVWFWAGAENKIVLVKDGGEMSSEAITPEQYEKVLNKKPGIPAICTVALKEVAKLVNDVLVEVKSDKTTVKDSEVQSGSRNILKENTSEVKDPSPESRGIAK